MPSLLLANCSNGANTFCGSKRSRCFSMVLPQQNTSQGGQPILLAIGRVVAWDQPICPPPPKAPSRDRQVPVGYRTAAAASCIRAPNISRCCSCCLLRAHRLLARGMVAGCVTQWKGFVCCSGGGEHMPARPLHTICPTHTVCCMLWGSDGSLKEGGGATSNPGAANTHSGSNITGGWAVPAQLLLLNTTVSFGVTKRK